MSTATKLEDLREKESEIWSGSFLFLNNQKDTVYEGFVTCFTFSQLDH